MENYEKTNAAVSTNLFGNDTLINEILSAVHKCNEYYARTGGRYLTKEDLEELNSKTIEKILESLHTYDPTKSKLSTWVSKLARNCQVDAFREAKKRRSMFVSYDSTYVDEEGDEHIDSSIECAMSGFEADRELESREAVSHILLVLDTLNPKQREVVDLTMDEVKPRQMADQLGCSPNAAATRLCKARQNVKQRLGEDFFADNDFAA